MQSVSSQQSSSWSTQQSLATPSSFNPNPFKASSTPICMRPITSTQNLPQKIFTHQKFRPVRLAPTQPTGIPQQKLVNTSSGISSSSQPISNYSRKVFIGGLPPDIGEDEITNRFRYFGNLTVDWPHKQETKSSFPPKGYAFLIFEHDLSVQNLINCCAIDNDKFYVLMSSPSIRDKPVQIRPWILTDSDFLLDNSCVIDQRRAIFVGGVPRPLKAAELAMTINKLFGGVCYASIDTDSDLKYPKGAGRVIFSNQQSYVAAITARFVQLQQGESAKRAEIKPYVLDEQVCDGCQGAKCNGHFAPYFCANITCLHYYCETCWASVHSKAGMDFHKPLVKEGADRPRTIPFRWC